MILGDMAGGFLKKAGADLYDLLKAYYMEWRIRRREHSTNKLTLLRRNFMLGTGSTTAHNKLYKVFLKIESGWKTRRGR